MILLSLPLGSTVFLPIVCLGPYSRTIGGSIPFFDLGETINKCLSSLHHFSRLPSLAYETPGPRYTLQFRPFQLSLSHICRRVRLSIQANLPSAHISTTYRPWLSRFHRPIVRTRTRLMLLIRGRLYLLSHCLWLALCLTTTQHSPLRAMRWVCRRLRTSFPHIQFLHSSLHPCRRLISKLLHS